MRYLITGGAGFIGSNLIRMIKAQDTKADIVVLDNLSIGKEYNIPDFARFKKGDITHYPICEYVCEGVDVVIHLAAQTSVPKSCENIFKDMRENIEGTINMLEAAKIQGVKKFIFASSAAPLGNKTEPVHEAMICEPVSPYGASKASAELYCGLFDKTTDMNVVVLRFSNVYGPGSDSKDTVIGKFIRNTFEDKPLEIYGTGGQTRDFIFIDDISEAILLSANIDNARGIYQIGSGKVSDLHQVIKILSTLVEKRIEVIYSDLREGDIKHSSCIINKAVIELGFTPKYILSKGIKITYEYYKEIYKCV